MTTPLPRLLLVLLPLIAACGQEPVPEPAAPTSAEEKDRRELLRSPAPDWKPGGSKRKLDILLLIDKTKIRKGESFAYRLEMQNAGREPLLIKEEPPSFTKDGSLCGHNDFKFYVTPPGGREHLVPCAPKDAAAAPESGLALTLAPGEYLLTRAAGPGNRFRPLLTPMRFDALGTYRLKAVYDPKGSFSAASNSVALEVVP